MDAQLLTLLTTGFLLGWSVAWPPGPINAEIARRCLANGFWAGFGVLLGACSGDALWAILVSLGVGAFLTGPTMRLVLGCVSILLLLALAAIFLRGAWTAFWKPTTAAPTSSRFESRRASFLLGASMALTSPWNVAFWLATMGRPEMTQFGTGGLLVMAAAVIAGALTWGLLWSLSVVVLHRRFDQTGGRDWWTISVMALTGLLMVYFAATSTTALVRSF